MLPDTGQYEVQGMAWEGVFPHVRAHDSDYTEECSTITPHMWDMPPSPSIIVCNTMMNTNPLYAYAFGTWMFPNHLG